MEWSNPHVVIHLDAVGADGQVRVWLVTTYPPNAAKRMGFPESSFAGGTQLTIDGYQASDGSNHVNGTSVVFPDGRKTVSPDSSDNGPNCYKPGAVNTDRVR